MILAWLLSLWLSRRARRDTPASVRRRADRGGLANARRAVELDRRAALEREAATRAVAEAMARAAGHPSALPPIPDLAR